MDIKLNNIPKVPYTDNAYHAWYEAARLKHGHALKLFVIPLEEGYTYGELPYLHGKLVGISMASPLLLDGTPFNGTIEGFWSKDDNDFYAVHLRCLSGAIPFAYQSEVATYLDDHAREGIGYTCNHGDKLPEKNDFIVSFDDLGVCHVETNPAILFTREAVEVEVEVAPMIVAEAPTPVEDKPRKQRKSKLKPTTTQEYGTSEENNISSSEENNISSSEENNISSDGE